jgi:hypothetical protein
LPQYFSVYWLFTASAAVALIVTFLDGFSLIPSLIITFAVGAFVQLISFIFVGVSKI